MSNINAFTFQNCTPAHIVVGMNKENAACIVGICETEGTAIKIINEMKLLVGNPFKEFLILIPGGSMAVQIQVKNKEEIKKDETKKE